MNHYKNYDILVAKCGKTIGLKGELKLILYTDFLDFFTTDTELLCENRILKVEKFNKNKNSIKFKEINDISDAKLLNSNLLYTSRELTRKNCKINNDEYFWFDIIGCNIFDKDVFIGKVIDINRIGNIDYLVVSVDFNLYTNYSKIKVNKFMLPYIDRYIIECNISTKEIKSTGAIGILEES